MSYRRRSLRPHFLVCYRGRFIVLEVDGRDYHARTAANNHARDLGLRVFGLPVYRCTASAAYRNTAKAVVVLLRSLVGPAGAAP